MKASSGEKNDSISLLEEIITQIKAKLELTI